VIVLDEEHASTAGGKRQGKARPVLEPKRLARAGIHSHNSVGPAFRARKPLAESLSVAPGQQAAGGFFAADDKCENPIV